MPRQPRTFLGDGTFHVTARGVARMAIYRDGADYAGFLALLESTVARFPWLLHAFCLMPNHYHLVVEATCRALSNGMHRLNGLYAQGFNDLYERTGHVFQNRFGARRVEEEKDLARVCVYVLQNPVRAGLCERAEDWPWSGGLAAWWQAVGTGRRDQERSGSSRELRHR